MGNTGRKRVIEVVNHNNEWENAYEKEAAKIKNIIKNTIAIHHIGSTAIKGIKAKPVIDILVEVKNITKVDEYNKRMEKIGYMAKGEFGIPERRYFQKGEPQHTHHVHVFEIGNPEISRHICFRDYLNSHPEEAEQYSVLKEKLAEEYRHDAVGYSEGKSSFIKEIDRKAVSWRSCKYNSNNPTSYNEDGILKY